MINALRKLWLSSKNLFTGGFFHVMFGTVLNKGITMISSIVVARLVIKTEYAYLAYSDTLYNYLALVSGLGLPSALLKFCSRDNNESGLDKSLLTYTIQWGGIFQLCCSLILCVIVSFAPIPFPEARVYLWIGVLYSTLSHVSKSFLCYLRAKLKTRLYALIGIAQSLSVCVFSIVFVLIFNAVGVVYSRYFSIALVLLIELFPVRKMLRGSKRAQISPETKRAFWAMGLSLMIAELFSGMMPINESFLVSQIIHDEVITANFRVAGIFPQMLLLVTSAVNIYFFPIISRIEDKRAALGRIYRVGLLNFCLILFCTVAGMLLSPWLISTFYGKQYLDAVPISYLLWIMRGLNAGFRMIPMNMLPAVGKTKFNAIVAIISCFVQIIVDYILISDRGITGVAYGTIVVYAMSGIAFWAYLTVSCRNGRSSTRMT